MSRLPRACLACAAIAFAHAALWAMVTPAFQIPDESSHLGYAQYIAEKGRVPNERDGMAFSDEQDVVIQELPFNIESRPTWNRARRNRLFRALDSGKLGRSAPGESATSTNYPPLYYAVEAVPYRIGYSANLLDRLFLMRLVSALIAALTVAFTFLFLRELMPSTPWAWTVGALAVAFQPVFAFLGGGVTPDNLLFASSAALVWLLARAFRRGLTPRLGAAIGLAAVAGVLTKQTMAGVLPGAALGLVLLVWRAPPERRREAVRGLLAAGVVLVIPVLTWLVASQEVYGRVASTNTGGLTSSSITSQTSIGGQLSYLWQSVLPRLPGTSDQIPYYIPWSVWIQAFIGRFGWFEFGFPYWANVMGAGILGVLAALAGATLVRCRAIVRSRWLEVLTYLAMAAGLWLLVEVAAYRYKASNGQFFEQVRYLFPLLPFWGALVALAARAPGRRWGPALGAFVVVLLMGHSLFALLIAISRWYA